MEKDYGTQQTKMGGELVFKTKQTFKTRVTKTFFVWIVSHNFSKMKLSQYLINPPFAQDPSFKFFLSQRYILEHLKN